MSIYSRYQCRLGVIIKTFCSQTIRITCRRTLSLLQGRERRRPHCEENQPTDRPTSVCSQGRVCLFFIIWIKKQTTTKIFYDFLYPVCLPASVELASLSAINALQGILTHFILINANHANTDPDPKNTWENQNIQLARLTSLKKHNPQTGIPCGRWYTASQPATNWQVRGVCGKLESSRRRCNSMACGNL